MLLKLTITDRNDLISKVYEEDHVKMIEIILYINKFLFIKKIKEKRNTKININYYDEYQIKIE
jgi:hypothetical protein